jgi:hypothetical protein
VPKFSAAGKLDRRPSPKTLAHDELALSAVIQIAGFNRVKLSRSERQIFPSLPTLQFQFIS